MQFLKIYGIAFAIFICLDGLWLGLVAKDFYRTQIGFLMKDDINWWAALIFYVLFMAGLVLFVIAPAIETKNIFNALLMGALFGLITYATYDLTNLATLKDWPLLVTFVDLMWGAVLCAAVSGLTTYIKINY